MSQKKHLSILEFSRLTGIKRDNLRFYDRIGLLSPDRRGENGYRYYSRRQLGSAYLIGSLRGLGVGLEDIKQHAARRSPENMLALFARQEERIQAEIAQLRETSEIMRLYADMARQALRHGEGALALEERGRERIILCPPIPEGQDEEEAEIAAYEYANQKGINMGYPLGAVVDRAQFASGRISSISRYYFKTGGHGNASKPAGLYAVAYGGGCADCQEALYQRLLDFMREQGVAIDGDVYGEYLLDELSVQDFEQYYARVEVPVRRSIEA